MFRTVEDEFASPCKSVALDPDQFLDDIVNRLKFGEAALGNDAMRRTIGLFRHENRQGIEAYDRRNERDGSKTKVSLSMLG